MGLLDAATETLEKYFPLCYICALHLMLGLLLWIAAGIAAWRFGFEFDFWLAEPYVIGAVIVTVLAAIVDMVIWSYKFRNKNN